MSLLVDSSVWISYFNGTVTPETNYLHKNLGIEEIIVGDIILAEVLQGFRHQRDFDQAKSALLKFEVIEIVGKDTAIQSAVHYRTLRAMGITVRKTIDCFIATRCLENGFMLLHDDKDFDPFEQFLGLLVQHP